MRTSTGAIVEAASGDRFMLGPDASAAPGRVHLQNAPVDYCVREVVLRMGPTRARHRFTIAVCRRPRSSIRCWWSLVSVYNTLGFDIFKHVASRWSWQSLPAFAKTIGEILPSQVIRSQQYDNSQTSKELTEVAERCLPWHGVGSAGLVILLARWHGASARRGGLAKAMHKLSAGFMLKAIVEVVCGEASLFIDLLVDDSFEFRWPRPPAGDFHYRLLVKVFGSVMCRVGIRASVMGPHAGHPCVED